MNEYLNYIVIAVLFVGVVIYIVRKDKDDKDKPKIEKGMFGFTGDYLIQLNIAIVKIKKNKKYGSLWKQHINAVRYNPIQQYRTDKKGNKIAVGGYAHPDTGEIILCEVAYTGPKKTGQNISRFLGKILCHEGMHIIKKEYGHPKLFHSAVHDMEKEVGF